MAEIQDTLTSRAKLSRYQSRPVSQKDPGQSKALNIHAVDAEMMNSVTKNLEKVFKINNDTKIAALDLEKNNINAQIADHYRKQETYVLENINKFKDQELDTEAFFKKYDNDELEIKKFEYGEGHTDQSKEQTEAIRNNAESMSRGKIRQMLHQELVRRTGDMLDNKANKSINQLRNNLIDQELNFKASKMGETFGDAMLINGKNRETEDWMVRYKEILDNKLYGDMMDKEEKDRRIYEYSQQLGNVLFEHYVKIDHKKAVKYAQENKFIVGGIPLDSGVVARFILNDEKTKSDELEAGKRAKEVSRLNEIATNNPTNLIQMFNADGKGIRPSTDQEWELMGEPNGFRTREHFDTAISTAVLKAEGKHKQAINLAKTKKKEEDRENFGAMMSGIHAYTTADNENARDAFIGKYYDKHEFPEGAYVWMVKDSFVKKMADKYDLDPKLIKKDLQNAVKGIPVRSPGSGMGTTDFNTFQSALVDYYTKKLFASEGGLMSVDPAQDSKYYSDQMNAEERSIYENIVRGFEGIINFDTDNFTDKSSTTLLNEWNELEKENVDATILKDGKLVTVRGKSLAFLTVADRYKGTVLARRVEDLVLRPNQTAMRDLKIPDRNWKTDKITDKEMDNIDKWYKKRGQDRSIHKTPVPGVFIYHPEHFRKKLMARVSSPLQADITQAERMKEEYARSDVK